MVLEIGAGPVVGRFDPGGVEGQREATVADGEFVSRAESGEGSGLDEGIQGVFGEVAGVGGAQVDRAAEGVGSVERAGGAPENLHGFEGGNVEILELVEAGETGREAAAVEEDDGVIALHTADEEGTLRSGLSGLDEMNADGLLEDVAEVAALRGADLGTGDRIDGGEEVAAFRLGLDRPRRDDGGVGFLHDFFAEDDTAIASVRLDRGHIERGDGINEGRDDLLLRRKAEGKEKDRKCTNQRIKIHRFELIGASSARKRIFSRFVRL